MKVLLVVVEGKPLGAAVPLKTNPFIIGREQGCHLRPRGEGVSDRQCAIIRRDAHVLVRDLGSDQGTLVNNRCLRRGEEMRVGDGDRLQVGPLIFAIRIDAEAEDLAGNGQIENYLQTPPQGRSGFFPAPSGSSIMPAPVGVAQAPPAAAPPAEEGATLAAAFAFQGYDEVRRVSVLGLSQAQLSEESDQRSLRTTLYDLVGRGRCARLVLDLSEIDELPSLSIAMMMSLARRCEAAGGKLRLCGGPERIREVLDALRFQEVVGWYEDKAEAVTTRWA